MKKTKILAAVVAATVLSVGGGVLAGCNSEHTHTYSSDWKSDANGHWHVATCDDLKEGDKDYKSGYAAHVWGDDNECDTCHYVKETPPPVVTEVTIKLDANGGSLEGDAETKDVETKNGKIETLPTPTAPAGMEFVGWYTEDIGGTAVTTDTPFTADGTVYAHYVTVYTITLDAGDGTLAAASVKAKEGKVTELPTPEAPDSKEFVGWYTTAEDTAEVTGTEVTVDYEFEEDITIYARYASVYTITLNVGESGTLPEGASETLTTKGGKLANLPTPVTQNALVFLGWYTTAEDTAEATGELITADKVFSGDELAVTLYARYRQEISVTLSVGEGTLPEGAEATVITTESKLAELPTPTAPANHWFKGWFTAETGGSPITASTKLTPDADTHTKTIYARYVAEVTVTLDAGEGNTLPDGAKTTYTTVNGKIQLEEGEKGLPAPTVTKEHWRFYGWVNGTKVVNVAETVFEADTTITAKIAQEDGLWSQDGQTFIAGLTQNQGNTSINEYWYGDGKTANIPKGKLTAYVGGDQVKQIWVDNSSTGVTKGVKVNEINVETAGAFILYLKDYSKNGTNWVAEFTIAVSAQHGGTEADIEGCDAIVMTFGEKTITFYLKAGDGTAIKEANFKAYAFHVWTGGDEQLGGWGSAGEKAAKVMTGTGNAIPEYWIIRYAASPTAASPNLQTPNIKCLDLVDGARVLIKLGTSGGVMPEITIIDGEETSVETPEVSE